MAATLLEVIGFHYYKGVDRFTVDPKGDSWDVVAVKGEKGTPVMNFSDMAAATDMADLLGDLRMVHEVKADDGDGTLLLTMIGCVIVGYARRFTVDADGFVTAHTRDGERCLCNPPDREDADKLCGVGNFLIDIHGVTNESIRRAKDE